MRYLSFDYAASTTGLINVTHRRHRQTDTSVRIPALGCLTSRRSCPGSGLWAVSNFVAFCPDWPPAVGPKIHIFCPDRDQGFPAIARGPPNGLL